MDSGEGAGLAGEIDIRPRIYRIPRIKKNKGITTEDIEGHRVIPYLVFVLDLSVGIREISG